MERKYLPLELKDIDKATRTAVIAHAHYNNIDRTMDISRKGMFNKSWGENDGKVKFYFNHDGSLAPGKVTNLYEDDQKAYTEVKLGTHTLGNDTLIQMDEGIATDASFGYRTIKSKMIEVKDQKVRELLEVKHIETSILTMMPANPEAGLVSVVKSLDEINTIALKIKSIRKFIRDTKASDECILQRIQELEYLETFLKSVLPGLDTADTQQATEPTASDDGEDVLIALQLLLMRA